MHLWRHLRNKATLGVRAAVRRRRRLEGGAFHPPSPPHAARAPPAAAAAAAAAESIRVSQRSFPWLQPQHLQCRARKNLLLGLIGAIAWPQAAF